MKSGLPNWIVWAAFAGAVIQPVDQIALAAPPPGTASAVPDPNVQASAPSVLYGTIRSVKDQKFLSGVPIVLENRATDTVIKTTTNAQGSYIFSNLPPGDYKVRVGGGSSPSSRRRES